MENSHPGRKRPRFVETVMEKIRSFIAIELPQEIKDLLGNLQTALDTGKDSSVKWVNPDSIHLTLKYSTIILHYQV